MQPYTEVPDPPVSLEFLQMVSDLMAQNNVEFPCTVKDAVELYVTLVELIEEQLLL